MRKASNDVWELEVLHQSIHHVQPVVQCTGDNYVTDTPELQPIFDQSSNLERLVLIAGKLDAVQEIRLQSGFHDEMDGQTKVSISPGRGPEVGGE